MFQLFESHALYQLSIYTLTVAICKISTFVVISQTSQKFCKFNVSK